MMTPILTAGLVCLALLSPGQDGAPQAALDLLPSEAREQVIEQEQEVARLREEGEDGRALTEGLGELGKLYYVYGLSDRARSAWMAAAEGAPNDFRWQYYLGVLDRIEGDLPAALGRFERVLELRPQDLVSRLRIGLIELEQGRLAVAAEAFEAVLEVAPESPTALTGLGRVALAEGRYEEAIARFERALSSQAEGSVLHHHLGLAYRGLGDLDKAREQLASNRGVAVSMSDPLMEQVVPLVRGAHFHARLGIQALRNAQVVAAAASLERAAELDPESAWVRYNLAVAYRAGGRLEESRRELLAALDLDPDYANAHFNLGTLLAAQGDFAAAADHFLRVREIDPGDHLARMELAVAVSRLGDSARAQAELESLIRDAPGLIEARLALATLLAGQGRGQEAQSIVEEALTIDATDQELASAHTAAGRLLENGAGEAEPHYRRAIELDPAATEARFRLALSLGRAGRFGESAREFEQLIERVPGQPDYRIGLSMALLLAEEYPRARRSLEEARTRFPDSIDLAHSLARVLATCPDDSVRDGAAALELARALMEAQQSLDHAETLGMALAEVGRFDEAAELQRQVVAELERRGAPAQLDASRRYLAGYGERRPVRAPWKGTG